MVRPRVLRPVPLMPLAGLSIVVVAGIAALLLSLGVARANHWVAHSIRMQVGIVSVEERLSAFESGFRGYLIRRNPDLRKDAEKAHADLKQCMAWLLHEAGDNPEQRRHFALLDRLIEARIANAEGLMALRETREMAQMPATPKGRFIMRPIRSVIAETFAEEDRLLAIRQRWLQTLTAGLALFLASAVLIVVVVGYLTINDASARYAELRQAHDETHAEMAKREAAESQLRQMQKMETLGQLTGGIAHDFNNMLAVIIGSLDMARRHAADPAHAERNMAAAQDGAERAAGLVARLLAFSRRQPLSPVALDANRMINGMSDLLRRTLGEQVTVETVLAGGLWHCFADSGQLENTLLNLAVNARDAIPEGSGGRLTLATANVVIAPGQGELAAGEYVEIAVSDTGAGMPPEVIERAFDPFFTTKEVGKGTGLGLSQVFGFAKQSGGLVAIDSAVGRGTTVRLHLPRYGGAATADEALAPAAIVGGRPDEIVLVVEDEPHVRHFSADALRDLGYTVLTADNGDAALRVLGDNPGIVLLFTDMKMPGMSGAALAEAARTLRPDLRTLFTTGYAAEDEEAAFGRGALLPKPFTIARLARKVREAIDGNS